MKLYSPPNLLGSRADHYESAARLIRWIVLILVLISYPFASPGGPAIIALIIMTALYNAVRYSRRLQKYPVVTSRINELAIDHLFIVFIVSLSGGISSPYYPLLFLLVMAMIVSYGIAGYAVALAVQGTVLVALYFGSNTILPADQTTQLVLRLAFLIVFSLVAEQSITGRDAEYLLESTYSRRLDRDRERLLTLINSLADPVIATDGAGVVTQYNGAALALLNTNVDLNGQSLDKLVPLVSESGDSVSFADLTRDGASSVVRNDLITGDKDRGKINIELTLSAVRVTRRGRNRNEGYMVVLRDITRQRSIDEERNEFISVSSHELRTPVAIAEANLSTLLLPGFTKLEPKAKTLLEQSHDNLVFLGELVQDLTTLSHAERDDLHPAFALVDTGSLMADLWRDYTASATSRDLDLKFTAPAGTVTAVSSDQEVREILQNFITNAIKYTEKGSITLAASRRHDGTVVLSVSDTGIGISVSDKSRLFGKFYRSEDFRTRRTTGTGLGLYIALKLAERLGGTIELETKLNRGSTFSLLLPVRGLDE